MERSSNLKVQKILGNFFILQKTVFGCPCVNSNYKSSHEASNFMVICIMLIKKVCMKYQKCVYGRYNLNLFFILHENNLSTNPPLCIQGRNSDSQWAKIPYIYCNFSRVCPPDHDGVINRENVYCLEWIARAVPADTKSLKKPFTTIGNFRCNTKFAAFVFTVRNASRLAMGLFKGLTQEQKLYTQDLSSFRDLVAM